MSVSIHLQAEKLGEGIVAGGRVRLVSYYEKFVLSAGLAEK